MIPFLLVCVCREPVILSLFCIYLFLRTDQGVHALCTAAHVDLEFNEDVLYSYHIIRNLNTFLTKRKYDIRYV